MVERRTSFVPNDLEMAHELVLVTGPNMAGKSTYLRQTASSPFWPRLEALCPRRRLSFPSSTGSLPGSGPPMTWQGGGAPSWWRWRRWP